MTSAVDQRRELETRRSDGRKTGEREITYVFDVPQNAALKETECQVTPAVGQIFPSVCASLTCIPFGLMLGWPSPTYPELLEPTTPIPITMDQTAMVAGFLMLGLSFGTLFADRAIGRGPKNGIVFGNLCITLGWLVMWKAQDLYGLLGSRFLLGTGHGYAMGQIKSYVAAATPGAPILTATLVKHLNFYAMTGFLIAYILGPFLDFRQQSLACLIVAGVVFFVSIWLPSATLDEPSQRVADKSMPFLRQAEEMYGVAPPQQLTFGFAKLARNAQLRRNFAKLTLLLIAQQYTALPPSMVYAQLFFAKTDNPHAEYLAIVYAVLLLTCTVCGTYAVPKYNKKCALLASSCATLAIYVCMIAVIYFDVHVQYFGHAPVILMYLFVVAHTFGLGVVPVTLIDDWFPKSYRGFVIKYYVVMFSLLALTITKIFQVLIGQFPLYVPFCLFASIAACAIVFIGVCVPYKASIQVRNSYRIGNMQECMTMQEKK